MPFIPYYRESRRIHGLVRFNLNDLSRPFDQTDELYRTGIAVGDYPVDHHHYRYHGYEDLPDLHFYPVPSYSLPMGVMLPQSVDGLIVAEKSISVSNLVNGTTRLQPVVLQIGQAAGAIAGFAVKTGKDVSRVPVRDVQTAILKSGGYLMPYLDVPANDPVFPVLQRIGSTGIMKGEGKSVGWENETWFRTEDTLVYNDLSGLKDVYPDIKIPATDDVVTLQGAIDLIETIAKEENIFLPSGAEKMAREIFSRFGIAGFSMKRAILRKEMALLIDRILDPFNRKPVDIRGNFI